MNSNVMGEGGPPVCVTSVALRVPGWLMMGISLCGNDATRFTGSSEAVGWATLGSQLEERQARAGFRHDALTPPAPRPPLRRLRTKRDGLATVSGFVIRCGPRGGGASVPRGRSARASCPDLARPSAGSALLATQIGRA